jgi:hypothetical protein
LLAVPLVDGEGTIGVMEWLDRADGLPFDLVDLEVATRVAAAATATARATRLEHDAGRLLVRVLGTLADRTDSSQRGSVEAFVVETAGELAGDDALWRLADRIAQLRMLTRTMLAAAGHWRLIERGRRRGLKRSRG